MLRPVWEMVWRGNEVMEMTRCMKCWQFFYGEDSETLCKACREQTVLQAFVVDESQEQTN
jgi:hypothetical protein